MSRALRLSALCGLICLCSAFTLRAHADSFTQSGVLASDNDVVTFDFSTATVQNYTFSTTSYAGGTNADGTTTPAGGFDPVLTLFTSGGTFVPNGVGGGSNSCTGVNTDSATGLCEDAYFTETLNPGSYVLALTEFPNYSSNTLSDFNPDNAFIISASCGTSNSFEDANSCTPRDGDYTVNYTSSAVTPEPPSALLCLLPMAGLVVLSRRRSPATASL